MLEKPAISDELIADCVQEAYGLPAADLSFLPIGADMGTIVYRLSTQERTTYFLKLRKGFSEIVVTAPLFLSSQGIQEVILPLETKAKQYWADFGEYTLILYPFIEGKNGFEMELTDQHNRRLGGALKAIHSAQIPPKLETRIPKESFSPHWRDSLKALQARVEEAPFQEPAAAKLADFMKARRVEISRLIERTEVLASELQSKPFELVLCHTDIHGANMLITGNDEFYIVDWDAPMLAPKERDLMFVGGGIDNIWKSKRDEAVFYEGYGKTEIDLALLAYYRYERIIADLVAYCELLFLTDEGGADREPAYETFKSNFEPGQTIEIARNTDLQEGIAHP